MAQGGKLKLLDTTAEGVMELREKNNLLFDAMGDDKWFYLANDEELPVEPNEIRIGYGDGKYCEEKDTVADDGALFFTTEVTEEQLARIKKLCSNCESGLKWFPLLNKKETPAFLGVIKMLDETEQVAIIVPNIDVKSNLSAPFMVNYNEQEDDISYEIASKEVGSLPFMAENDTIADMLLPEIQNLIGYGIQDIKTDGDDCDDEKLNDDETADDNGEEEKEFSAGHWFREYFKGDLSEECLKAELSYLINTADAKKMLNEIREEINSNKIAFASGRAPKTLEAEKHSLTKQLNEMFL